MEPDSPSAEILLGTTLYSLTNEYHSRRYSLEALIRKVSELGIGPGLEVVGFQSFRNFPHVTDGEAEHFLSIVRESGLTLSCLGINADRWITRSREMTPAESVAYHRLQLEAAAKLKFPLVRYQYAAGPDVIEQLVPDAERLNVKLALEIHAPHHVEHPEIIAYREMYDRLRSPLLGFVPDFGASARAVPSIYVRYFEARGISSEIIQCALEIWAENGDPFARRAKFLALGPQYHWNATWVTDVSMIFNLFSRQPALSWLQIMPQVFHVHGKFYAIGDDGVDAAIPYEQLIPVLIQGGYRGFISSEWEGHQVTDNNGFAQVQKHHSLERRILRAHAPS
jgi:sugar phosphate isomerase/epimerase